MYKNQPEPLQKSKVTPRPEPPARFLDPTKYVGGIYKIPQKVFVLLYLGTEVRDRPTKSPQGIQKPHYVFPGALETLCTSDTSS